MTDLTRYALNELQAQEIHLWWACPGQFQTTDVHWRHLSCDEQDRAWRFKRDRDRNRYVLTRSILRNLLSLYLRMPASDIRFGYGSKGKPALKADVTDDPIEFNVSHSHNFILLGFSRQAIGVDVEYIKPDVQATRLAQRFFTSREYAALQALPPEEQRSFFFRLWTRKESCIKATGESLFEQIGQLEVPCCDYQEAQWMKLEQQSLQVQDVRLHPHYCAAIASVSDRAQIYCFEI